MKINPNFERFPRLSSLTGRDSPDVDAGRSFAEYLNSEIR